MLTNQSQSGPQSGRSTRDASSMSEDSGFSTPGGSSVGSPVFFEDRLSEHGKLSPHQTDELAYESHHSPPDVLAMGHVPVSSNRMEPVDNMKSLPHKLRFKSPNGGECDNPGDRQSPVLPAVGQRFHRLSGTTEGAGYWTPQDREDPRKVMPPQQEAVHELQPQCEPKRISIPSREQHAEVSAQLSQRGSGPAQKALLRAVAHQNELRL